MKKLISHSLFVMMIMAAAHTAQAQIVVVRPFAPVIVAGGPRFYGPVGRGRGFRCAPVVRPYPIAFYPRPRFYRRPLISARVRVW